MNKLQRNLSTDENKKFWASVDRSAQIVAGWPDWRRAGINVAQVREEPREELKAGTKKKNP